jgi:hypothetical protein
MIFNKRQRDFLIQLTKVSDTVAGRKVLKYLHEIYVEASAVQPTVEQTYYKLGQKELIQSIIKDAGLSMEDIERIEIIGDLD